MRRTNFRTVEKFKDFSTVPRVSVGVAVAEVVHVHAVLLQAAGALLHAGQEASPVAPPLPFAVQPPGHRTAVCNKSTGWSVKAEQGNPPPPPVWPDGPDLAEKAT